MTALLSGIRVFPVKSLGGVSLEEIRVQGGAGLARDREFRLVDDAGATLNGKTLGEKLIGIESGFDLAFGVLRLRDDAGALSVRLPGEEDRVAEWLESRLGRKVRLERDEQRGFPDDEEASGPTIVSRATLEQIGAWFDFSEDEARRRLRANLEIDGVPAFWEDRLYGPEGETLPFQIGDVRFEGVNPCARCAVPTRDSRTGTIPEPRFAKIFADRRRENLPAWAEASRFNHYFRAAVNTRIPAPENGKTLAVGDEVRLG